MSLQTAPSLLSCLVAGARKAEGRGWAGSQASVLACCPVLGDSPPSACSPLPPGFFTPDSQLPVHENLNTIRGQGATRTHHVHPLCLLAQGGAAAGPHCCLSHTVSPETFSPEQTQVLPR